MLQHACDQWLHARDIHSTGTRLCEHEGNVIGMVQFMCILHRGLPLLQTIIVPLFDMKVLLLGWDNEILVLGWDKEICLHACTLTQLAKNPSRPVVLRLTDFCHFLLMLGERIVKETSKQSKVVSVKLIQLECGYKPP